MFRAKGDDAPRFFSVRGLDLKINIAV